MSLLYIIIFLFLFGHILQAIISKRNNEFSTYFGVPGSGKTTFAAWLARKYLKRNLRRQKKNLKIALKNVKRLAKGKKPKKLKTISNVYSNVAIYGCKKSDRKDWGKYLLENGLCLNDEAGIDLDNRNYADKKEKLSKEQIELLKKHRHYNLDMIFFSQYWNDIDIKIRNLSTKLYLVKRSLIPFFILRKTIKKKIGINKDTKQIEDQYFFDLFGRKYIFTPTLWKLFKTHDKKDLPSREFEIYS